MGIDDCDWFCWFFIFWMFLVMTKKKICVFHFSPFLFYMFVTLVFFSYFLFDWEDDSTTIKKGKKESG